MFAHNAVAHSHVPEAPSIATSVSRVGECKLAHRRVVLHSRVAVVLKEIELRREAQITKEEDARDRRGKSEKGTHDDDARSTRNQPEHTTGRPTSRREHRTTSSETLRRHCTMIGYRSVGSERILDLGIGDTERNTLVFTCDALGNCVQARSRTTGGRATGRHLERPNGSRDATLQTAAANAGKPYGAHTLAEWQM
jgi:hypothetical protein